MTRQQQILAGSAAVLTLILAVVWLPGAPAIPEIGQLHVGGGKGGRPQLAARDTANWASAVLARPLFTVGRKPALPPHSSSKFTFGATLPRLSGIIVTPAGKRAIFSPDGGKPITVPEGGTIDDQQVRRITPNSVILSGPKGDVQLFVALDKDHVPSAINPVTGGFPRPPVFPVSPFVNGFGNPAFRPMGIPGGFTPPQPQLPPPANNGDDSPDNGDNNATAPAVPAIPNRADRRD